MREIWEMIRRLGRSVVIEETGKRSVTVRAILEPVDSKSKAAMEHGSFPGGQIPPGSYQYFGPPEVEIGNADRLRTADGCFLVRRWEKYYRGAEPVYLWGLLVRGGDADDGA